jgi:hypothetical protein
MLRERHDLLNFCINAHHIYLRLFCCISTFAYSNACRNGRRSILKCIVSISVNVSGAPTISHTPMFTRLIIHKTCTKKSTKKYKCLKYTMIRVNESLNLNTNLSK